MSQRIVSSTQEFRRFAVLLGVCAASVLAASAGQGAPANMSVAQIVDKHVAARGGLQTWHGVQTLAITGKMDAGSGDSAARSQKLARDGMGASAKRNRTAAAGAAPAAAQQVQLPYTLEMKRPHKSRLEIQFAGTTAVQVYDGQNGWKYRPFLNRSDVEAFSADELKTEAARADMEGPLMDYAAKGSKVELAGSEPVEGHDAYKLKLTLKDGEVQHIWIDAKTFLDVKVEGVQRRMDGTMHNVYIMQRDFRPEQGLTVPHVYESVVDGYPQTHKMSVDTVAVNRPLDDSRFSKPAGGPGTPVKPVPVAANQ